MSLPSLGKIGGPLKESFKESFRVKEWMFDHEQIETNGSSFCCDLTVREGDRQSVKHYSASQTKAFLHDMGGSENGDSQKVAIHKGRLKVNRGISGLQTNPHEASSFCKIGGARQDNLFSFLLAVVTLPFLPGEVPKTVNVVWILSPL